MAVPEHPAVEAVQHTGEGHYQHEYPVPLDSEAVDDEGGEDQIAGHPDELTCRPPAEASGDAPASPAVSDRLRSYPVRLAQTPAISPDASRGVAMPGIAVVSVGSIKDCLESSAWLTPKKKSGRPDLACLRPACVTRIELPRVAGPSLDVFWRPARAQERPRTTPRIFLLAQALWV